MVVLTTKLSKEYKPLSANSILEQVREEEIFRYYCGFDFDLKTCYKSCLRDNDNTPSLNFYYNKNGQLCYKDFGGSQGSCFTFVMAKYGIEFKDALERINADMGLGLGFNKTIVEKVRYPEFVKEFSSQRCFLQFVKTPMLTSDLEWWALYGSFRETVSKYVYKAKEIWKDGYLHWTSTDKNPIYVYHFPKSGHIKAYRPLAEPYTNKNGKEIKVKFITNCDAFDLHGYDQLPESGKLLINTKSGKDCMLFHELGIPAVAPQGEGHHIPKILQMELKDRFEHIITVYDNDDAGVKASIKINQDMGSGYWNIPKEYGVKDPTDFYRKYGINETINLLSPLYKYLK